MKKEVQEVQDDRVGMRLSNSGDSKRGVWI